MEQENGNRVTSLLRRIFGSLHDVAERDSRALVYAMSADYLSGHAGVAPEQIMPSLLEFLGERDSRLVKAARRAAGDVDDRQVTELRERIADRVLQVGVRYTEKRGRSPDTQTSREESYAVECVLLIAGNGDGETKRVQLSRALSRDELPSIVRKQFFRSAEEVELQLYPLSSPGGNDGPR